MDDASRWKSYFEQSAEPLVVIGTDLSIEEVNPALEALSGYRQEALVGQPIGVLFSEAERARVPFRFDLLDQAQVVRSSRRLRCRTGAEVPVETVTNRLAGGGYLASVRDMCEIRRAEEALRLSEDKFAQAFRASPDAINLTRMSDGVYLDINEGFTKMTGWTAAEVVGRSALPGDLSIWDRVEDRSAVVAQLQTRGEVNGYEARFRGRDGSLVIGVMSARRIDVGGEPCLLTVTRDVTELRRTEDALRSAQKLEALGVLAGGIAHDFNNLLTGVFGYVEVARNALPEGEARTQLDGALAVFDRAKALTLQLLTFSRGGAPMRQTVDLSELIGQTVQFALSGSTVRCDLQLAQPLWPCEADPNQIGQVLENLVLNARQATNRGGITVRADNISPGRDLPPGLPPGNYLRITVEDEGTGIRPEHLAKIFDPFFTTKANGTGLGLATSYSIVQKHGGRLTAESEWGQGSRFTVYLPAGGTLAAPGPQRVDSGPPTDKTILHVDDEAFLRDITAAMLTHGGHTVLSAANGDEAVEAFNRAHQSGQPIDVVLLDLTLPGGETGTEVLRRLQDLAPGVVAVATSGYSVDPVMGSPEAYGFAASLTKPFLERDLKNLWVRLADRLPSRRAEC